MIHAKGLLTISILGCMGLVSGTGVISYFACGTNRIVHAAKQAPVTAPYFPPGSVWTQDVSHAPIDPQSSTIISWLADQGGWGKNGKMQVDWNIRVVEAKPDTPKVPFQPAAGFFEDASDGVTMVPLPEGGGIEGQPDYHCNNHAYDCHFIVADRGNGKLYEAWAATYTGTAVTAKFLDVWDLHRVYPLYGRGDNCTSADAAGFPIAPLVFNADELAAGSINHAIRFVLPSQKMRAHVFVHPATHAGGPSGPKSAPPMGAHFRLKASFDMSQLTPAAQVVARAMQKYGMFLADQGNIALTAQSEMDTETKYADVGFDSHSLWPIQVTDFEVLELGKPIPLTRNCILKK